MTDLMQEGDEGMSIFTPGERRGMKYERKFEATAEGLESDDSLPDDDSSSDSLDYDKWREW